MTPRVPVHAQAADPVTRAGLEAHLRVRPDLRLVGQSEVDQRVVGVVAADTIGDAGGGLLDDLRGQGCERIVLIIVAVESAGLLAAVTAGVRALLRRGETTPGRLAEVVKQVAGDEAALPPDLLAGLLCQVRDLQDRQVGAPRLSARERAVLRLVADGFDTDEIARHLSYSSRTVKNVLYAVTERYELRNRSHAVAFAVRNRLI